MPLPLAAITTGPNIRQRAADERAAADFGCLTTQQIVENRSGGGVAVHRMVKDGVQNTFRQDRCQPAILYLKQGQADCASRIWSALPRALVH
jgi:hypothetical protein